VRASVVCSIITFATAATLLAQDSSLDYTQWRGLNRDGSASAFSEPRAWPERLTRTWKVEVGEGYATPILSGRLVYVFTRRDGNEGITALDADTGRERWRSSYAAPYTPSQPAAAHGAGPKATPLLHRGRLFTLGISGIVTAFDAATGARVWQTDAPAEPPFFSAASSPVGDGQLVMAHPGNYGPLTAFDASTGAVVWTAGDGGFFASPIVVTLTGVRQVVTMTQSAVIGVSLPDGRVLWRYPLSGANGGGPTPVVDGDTIMFSVGQGTVAIRPTLRDGTWSAPEVWQSRDVSMYISTPVVVSNTLYGLSTRSSGQFYAIDTRSGETLWLGPPRQAANTALVKAGQLLFYLNDDGELIVAPSNRTRFEPLIRYKVADSATWAQPMMSGKRIFIKDVSSLALWTVD
jgi:outer membrane protein assembly factor BamB